MSKRDREWFQALVTRGDHISMHAIGRALVHLYNRQTTLEKATDSTQTHNLMGFTGADAHSGSKSARYYKARGHLQDWVIEMWLKPNVKGVPRIVKYWAQIAEEADKKDREKQLALNVDANRLVAAE